MATNLIFDGSNLEYRMFAIVKNSRTTKTGEHVACIFSFLQVFKNIVKKFNPENIFMCWDKKLCWPSTNFRMELTAQEYKATRQRMPGIEIMYEQEPKIVEILKTLGCVSIFPRIMEGDDIISWLSHTQDGDSVIVTVDHDIYQLINEHVVVYNPGIKKIINLENFEEMVGIGKPHFKLYKAIQGDISDNIDGIPGYGPVRAKKLAMNWSQINIIEDYKKIVEKNLQLIDLDVGYKYYSDEVLCYEQQLKEQKDNVYDIGRFKKYCEKYEFIEFLNKFQEWETLFTENTIANLINSYFNK